MGPIAELSSTLLRSTCCPLARSLTMDRISYLRRPGPTSFDVVGPKLRYSHSFFFLSVHVLRGLPLLLSQCSMPGPSQTGCVCFPSCSAQPRPSPHSLTCRTRYRIQAAIGGSSMQNGHNVPIVGINWARTYGCYDSRGVCNINPLNVLWGKLSDLGFNTVRLTFATEMVDDILDNGGDVTRKGYFEYGSWCC